MWTQARGTCSQGCGSKSSVRGARAPQGSPGAPSCSCTCVVSELTSLRWMCPGFLRSYKRASKCITLGRAALTEFRHAPLASRLPVDTVMRPSNKASMLCCPRHLFQKFFRGAVHRCIDATKPINKQPCLCARHHRTERPEDLSERQYERWKHHVSDRGPLMLVEASWISAPAASQQQLLGYVPTCCCSAHANQNY